MAGGSTMASTRGNQIIDHRGRTINNEQHHGVENVIKLHPFIIHTFLRKAHDPLAPSIQSATTPAPNINPPSILAQRNHPTTFTPNSPPRSMPRTLRKAHDAMITTNQPTTSPPSSHHTPQPHTTQPSISSCTLVASNRQIGNPSRQ